MSAAYHLLGTLQIPRGMVWSDEFDWTAVDRAVEYSGTGALLIDEAVKQAGRPITLAAADDAGWIRRDVLVSLQALAAVTDSVHLLTLADGRTFSVRFAPDAPIEARPVARPELPLDTHPYVATVRLIEV